MALRFTMHIPSFRILSRLRQAAALTAAFLCFWMATVGVAGHTDDLRLGASSSPKVVWGHHLTAFSPTDTCAACQWLAGVQANTLASSVVLQPHDFGDWAYPATHVRSSQRVLTQNGTRAPPAISVSKFTTIVS